jgi:hypothetical protein
VRRGTADGVRHEESGVLGKGEIRKLTQVSVEECGYGHEMGEGDWAGSDSSERGIFGAQQKVLPDIPYNGK